MLLQDSIPKSVRKTYNKSFLYNIAINISYNTIDWDSKEESVRQSLLGKGWKSADEQIKGTSGIFMSKDNSVIVISSKGILLSIPKPDYKGFESISNIVDIEKLLQVIGTKDVQGIFLSKNNRYVMKKELEKSSKKTLKILFSPSFLKKYDDETGLVTISEKHLLMFSIKRELQDDFAIINFLLTISKSNSVLVSSVSTELNKMNEIMYSAWRWSVSDDVIMMMEKGDIA